VVKRRLARDRGGHATAEFALSVFGFVLLLMAVVEIAWQGAVVAGLDLGTRRASRWATTGAEAPGGIDRASHIEDLILRVSGLPLRAADLTVTADSFGDFPAAARGTGAAPGPGGPSDIVRYTVRYRSRPITPLGPTLLPLGLLEYSSVVLVQNEPYPTAP
jgi:hypothetical protein